MYYSDEYYQYNGTTRIRRRRSAVPPFLCLCLFFVTFLSLLYSFLLYRYLKNITPDSSTTNLIGSSPDSTERTTTTTSTKRTTSTSTEEIDDSKFPSPIDGNITHIFLGLKLIFIIDGADMVVLVHYF